MTQSNDKICWLFVGSTGCGKSSLINTLTNKTVKVGNSKTSTTEKPAIFESNINSNIFLMDTVGFEDTKCIPFKEILLQTSNLLHTQGSSKIKVIWCVKPDDKNVPKLQEQAKFINSLNKNIWKSVMIAIKQATDTNSYTGPLASTNTHTDVKIPIMNIHGLSWTPPTASFYKAWKKLKLEDRIDSDEDSYYLYENEIPKVLNDKISKLKHSDAIKFKKIFYHDSNNCKLLEKKKHLGILSEKYIHEKEWILKYEHSEKITIEKSHNCGKKPIMGHSGQLIQKKRHDQQIIKSEWYHDKRYQSKKSKHPETKRCCPACLKWNIGSYTSDYESRSYSYVLWIEYNNEYSYKFNCYACRCSVDVRDGYYECRSCKKRYCKVNCVKFRCIKCKLESTSEGCINNSKWICCFSKNKNAPGCKEKKSTVCIKCNDDYYNSTGCISEQRYENCNHLSYENNCIQIGQEWICGNKDDNGCSQKKYYKCCGNDPNLKCSISSGGEYPCCPNSNKDTKGCKDISKWSGCEHSKNSLECTIDYKYYSKCKIKENETLNKKCGNGKIEWIPQDFDN